MGMEITSLACLQLADFAVDEPAVPEALPEVPAEAGEAVEEAEFEEVADAEVGNGASSRISFPSLCRQSYTVDHMQKRQTISSPSLLFSLHVY